MDTTLPQPPAASPAPALDPVTFEVLRSVFDFACLRMSKVLQKSAFSPILSDILDFSNAIYDSRIRLLAQAAGCPVHLAAMHFSAEAAVEKFGIENIHPGDVVVLNDPYKGGTHIPDITFTMPIYFEEQLLGFAVSRGHWTDLGGGTAGGQSFGTHVAGEGLRLPPLKLFNRYKLNDDLADVIRNNTRCPEYIDGDIQAHMGALKVAEQELQRIARKYGVGVVKAAMDEIIAYTARQTRQGISDIPDGDYVAEDFADTDGYADEPIGLKVKISVRDDEMTVDFDGSDRQCVGAINSPLANTHSAVYLALRFFLCPDAPANAGMFEPVTILLPDDCWLNAKWPGPTIGCTTVSSAKIASSIWQALAQAIPSRAIGSASSEINWFVCAVNDPDTRETTVFSDLPAGGWGGTPYADGMNVTFDPTGNCMNLPAETAELHFPIIYEAFDFRQDSAGAGRHRGGVGSNFRVKFLGDAELSIETSRTIEGSPGVNGGGVSIPQIMRHERTDGSSEVIGGWAGEGDWRKCLLAAHRFGPGETFVFQSTGGGGWGDPLDRPEAAVLDDVLDEYISIEAAERDYGVVIDPKTLTVDADATSALRTARGA